MRGMAVRACIVAVVLTFLSACENKPTVVPPLIGSWEHRLLVPEGQQGRCVDEKVTFDQFTWRSDVVVHATFACDQPYYSVSYQGDVEKSDAIIGQDDQFKVQVKEIELVSVADINRGVYDYLSDSVVENMQERLLSGHSSFSYQIKISSNQARAQVFPPVTQFVTEGYRFADTAHIYSRR